MTVPRPTITPNDRTIDAATYGLTYAAERAALNLRGYDAREIARIVAVNALNAGQVVTSDAHRAALDDAHRATQQAKESWARVYTQAGQQLERVQRALSRLPDRALAAALALEIGVLLLPSDDTPPVRA